MSIEKTKAPGIDEKWSYLNCEARIHKFGFLILILFIILAIFGFFSGGFFSDTVAQNATKRITLHYEKFGRLQTQLKINISATTEPPGKNVYRIGGDFNAFYEAENIWPLPDQMYSKGGDLYLVYNKTEMQEDTAIWLIATPIKPGRTHSTLRLNNEPEISFRQYIYP